MQDTWLVTADGGVPLADLPLKIYDGTEQPPVTEPKLSEPVLAGAGGSDYERYLRTDELLALQKEPGEWAHRDELLFQTVHQSSELWLKLANAEVAEATRLIESVRPRRSDQAARPERRLPEDRHRGARHARASRSLGVPGGAEGPRSRERLRLAGLPGDRRRSRRRSARPSGPPARPPASARSRSTRAAASTRSCTGWPTC